MASRMYCSIFTVFAALLIENAVKKSTMLAMVESVDHVIETAKRLPDVPIVALVETARGLERITEIAATKGTFRLAFGKIFLRLAGQGLKPFLLFLRPRPRKFA